MMMMMRMIIPFEAAGCGSSNNCTPASAAAPGRPSLHNTTHRLHPHNLQRPHNLQDTHNLHYPHFLKSPLNYYLSNPLREAIKYCLADFIGQRDPPPFADMLLHCTISFYSEIQNPSLTHNVHYGSDKIDEKRKTPNVKLPTKSSPSLALWPLSASFKTGSWIVPLARLP